MRDATVVEQIWMSGFMDGEGSFFIERTHSERVERSGHRPRAAVSNTELLALDMFLDIYGGRLVKTERPGTNSKDSYMWTCPAAELKRFIDDVSPYLRLKKRQSEIILEYLSMSPVKKGPRINNEPWRKREDMRLSIGELNRRGR